MALKLLFQFLELLASFEALSQASAAAIQQHPIAKPNCMDSCGNVHLPFPFGVGRGCFLDEWYEIVCLLNDTEPRPRLKKLNLEVLNISLPWTSSYNLYYYPPSQPLSLLDGNVTVSFPITYSNSSCANNATRDPITFQQSPFVISETDNIFLGFGCDVTTRLQFVDDTSFIGCTTQCMLANSKRNSSSSCSCFGYCISTVLPPPSPQSYSVEFDQGGGIREHCGFASLVQKTWFKPNQTDLYNVMNQGYVPVMLEWGILNATLRDELVVSTNDRFSPFNCTTTNYINHNTTPLMQCVCYYGFGGNAYLTDGCQDINECESENNCQKCQNTYGSYICKYGGYSSRMQNLTMIGIYVGIGAAPVILIVLAIWFLYKWIMKRNQIKLKKKLFKECVNRGIVLQQQFSGDSNVQHGKLFSSKKLRKATDKYNKNRILGQGGQGTVYKGTLKDRITVAVKKSKEMDDAYLKQFINEVVILSQINHRNIVKLLGVCLETKVPVLVYEFIPNGTLYHYLHHPNDEFPLTWDARLKIAIEVAGALSYMHSASSVPIYHRDIKSANILMDEFYRAKVADFGISRIVSLDQTHLTTLVQGTFGYLDPEYYQSSQYTDKSDVYSFGVVLVELLTGQEPISSLREEEDINLAAYFLHSLRDNRLFDILDSEVSAQAEIEEIEIVAKLTKRCLHMNGRNRPTMREVATKLESIRGFPQNGDHHQRGGSRQSSFAEDNPLFEVISGIDSTSDVQPLAHFQTW